MGFFRCPHRWSLSMLGIYSGRWFHLISTILDPLSFHGAYGLGDIPSVASHLAFGFYNYYTGRKGPSNSRGRFIREWKHIDRWWRSRLSKHSESKRTEIIRSARREGKQAAGVLPAIVGFGIGRLPCSSYWVGLAFIRAGIDTFLGPAK